MVVDRVSWGKIRWTDVPSQVWPCSSRTARYNNAPVIGRHSGEKVKHHLGRDRYIPCTVCHQLLFGEGRWSGIPATLSRDVAKDVAIDDVYAGALLLAAIT